MYFCCICGEEGDLHVLLFRHLLLSPKPSYLTYWFLRKICSNLLLLHILQILLWDSVNICFTLTKRCWICKLMFMAFIYFSWFFFTNTQYLTLSHLMLSAMKHILSTPAFILTFTWCKNFYSFIFYLFCHLVKVPLLWTVMLEL